MFYGAAIWDPVLIVSQIVANQCLFYLSLGLLEALFLRSHGRQLTIMYIFSWRQLDFQNYVGWTLILANLLNSLLSSVYLLWIVERAKKCLDFASTCFAFHLLFCCLYGGFPANLEWWATNTLGLLIMSLVGEWLCVRREMREIPVSNTTRAPRGGRGSNVELGQQNSKGASTSR